MAVAVLAFAISYVVKPEFTGLTTVLSFTIAWVTLFLAFRLHKISSGLLVSYINMTYPQLQESADLLLKDTNSLTTLERIQLSKTLQQLDDLIPKINVPHHIGRAALALIASGIIVLVFAALDVRFDSIQQPGQKRGSETRESVKSEPPASLASFTIKISPPAYTQQRVYGSETFSLKVSEGSEITWQLKFSETPQRTTIHFAGKDSSNFDLQSDQFRITKQLTTSTIYQITWTDNSGVKHASDFYQLEVIPDKSPEITIHDLRQSIELTLKNKPTIDVKARISDDYNITEAYLIATVAKGSGESVKFREEKLKFSQPATISGKKVQARRTIDIRQLGLEPGDELYFYAEAFDNQYPTRNRTRTETFFITLLDTAALESVVDAGLGVDLMPEYFRSQRQIIMDTEKLLRNKKAISKKEFNFLSNELGYDQKVLRLKYGEFLGEEFESELAPSDEGAEEQIETGAQDGDDDEENLAEKFGHAHDTENEHNLVDEKKHNHADEAKDPEAKEDPLEAFVHAHDDAEEATFFLQSVRTKLKAALTEMWDAELYLRLYQPEKSLPYQYKALKLLKEVSNDSRIYVHKTGFDPPPIKEEKRLTGDLSEIKNSNREDDRWVGPLYPEIRKAVSTIDKLLLRERIQMTDREKETFTRAGQELTPLALRNPGTFLPALSLIKKIQENQVKQGELQISLRTLQKILYSAIPVQQNAAAAANARATDLDQSFIDNLQKLKND